VAYARGPLEITAGVEHGEGNRHDQEKPFAMRSLTRLG